MAVLCRCEVCGAVMESVKGRRRFCDECSRQRRNKQHHLARLRRRAEKRQGAQVPESVLVCLNCERASCRGYCDKFENK